MKTTKPLQPTSTHLRKGAKAGLLRAPAGAGARPEPDPDEAPIPAQENDFEDPAPFEIGQTFKLAFENSSIGMAIVALDGTYLRVNRTLCALLGYTPDEMARMTFQSLTHPEDVDQDIESRDHLIAGTLDVYCREKRYLHRDGSVVWVQISVALVRSDEGEPQFFISQIADITSLKRAEEEQRRQAAELRALHETTLALLDRVQPDDVLERIVKSAADLAGTDHGYVYVVDADLERVVVRVGIGIFADAIGYRLAKGEGIAGRAWELGRAVRADDYRTLPKPRAEFMWLRSVLAVPLVSRGEVIGVIGLAHPEQDVRFTEAHEALLTRFAQLASMVLENATLLESAQAELAERRKAEEQIKRYAHEMERANRELREADEIKDQFVAMASHELRTPLTNVMGFSKTVLKRWEVLSDEERRLYIQTVDRNCDRLYDLVADLLTTARIESGALEIKQVRIDVRAAIASATSTVIGADAMEVACEPGLAVLADPVRLEQILVNYVQNALKHGAPPFAIEASRAGRSVLIVVADHGPGIPEAFLPRLFQRFAQADGGLTRRTEGSGLGLSIVRALARAMGGDAWFDPSAPAGARFCVRLPAAHD